MSAIEKLAHLCGSTEAGRVMVEGDGTVHLAGWQQWGVSRDGGATFARTRVNKGVHFFGMARGPDGRVVLCGIRGMIASFDDDGVTWTSVTVKGKPSLRGCLATPEGTMVVGDGVILFRAAGTDLWETVHKAHGVMFFGAARSDAGAIVVLAAETVPGTQPFEHKFTWSVWVSDDGGRCFTAVDPGAQRALAVLSDGTRFYLPDGYDRILASDDQGRSWFVIAHPGAAKTQDRRDNRIVAFYARGEVLYAVDATGAVRRSGDRGVHWETVGEVDEVHCIDSAPDGTLFLSGYYAVWRLHDPALVRPLTPVARPAATPPASVAAAPEVTGTAALIERLLVAWRAERHPALAEAIESLSATLPVPGTDLRTLDGPSRQAGWMKLAKQGGPAAVPHLLETFRAGTLDELKDRVGWVVKLPDDPRVASLAACFVEECAYGSTGSKPLWTALCGRLVALRDPRTVPRVTAAATQGAPVTGATMKAWLDATLPRVANQLAAACAGEPVLTPAAKALLDEAAGTPSARRDPP